MRKVSALCLCIGFASLLLLTSCNRRTDNGTRSPSGNSSDPWTFLTSKGTLHRIDVKDVAIQVTAKPYKGDRISVVLRVTANGNDVRMISKDGQAIPAEVRILDSAGNLVTSKKGSLGNFGFS